MNYTKETMMQNIYIFLSVLMGNQCLKFIRTYNLRIITPLELIEFNKIHDCSKTVHIYKTYIFISNWTTWILLWKVFKNNKLILLA